MIGEEVNFYLGKLAAKCWARFRFQYFSILFLVVVVSSYYLVLYLSPVLFCRRRSLPRERETDFVVVGGSSTEYGQPGDTPHSIVSPLL